jgi:hypothetical protein
MLHFFDLGARNGVLDSRQLRHNGGDAVKYLLAGIPRAHAQREN